MIKTYPRNVQVGITTQCLGKCYKRIGYCCRSTLYQDGMLDESYKKNHLDLDLLKPLFDEKGFKHIVFIGHLGDAPMHPKFLDFVKYLVQDHPDVDMDLSTCGAMRTPEWWKELGDCFSKGDNNRLVFCMDGLSDTHHLYRGTNFETTLNHAKQAIEAGAKVTWQFIIFEHNKHQVKEAKQLSVDLGFAGFEPIISVFYNDKLRKPFGIKTFDEIVKNIKNPNPSICPWQKDKMIYITEACDVHPCCNMNPQFVNMEGVGERYIDILDLYLKHKEGLSLYKYDLDDILNNPYLQHISHKFNSIKQCSLACRIHSKITNIIFYKQVEGFMDNG